MHYLIYKSGILMGKVLINRGIHIGTPPERSTPEEIKIELYNEYTGSFSEATPLNDAINRRLITRFGLDLIKLFSKMREYAVLINKNRDSFVTEEGQIYTKKNEHLWVEREKQFPVDIIVYNGEVVGYITSTRDSITFIVREDALHLSPISYWEEANKRPLYGVTRKKTFMVEMRDGTRLATDVWMPEGLKKAPIVFVRTPYGKIWQAQGYRTLINRGFALVVQDVRGRDDSEGEWIPFYHEIEDGYDSIEWITTQPFYNGRLGMIGASYSGFVQWAAASSGTQKIDAMVSIVTAGTAFTDIPMRGGCLVSGSLVWVFAMSERKANFELMKRDNWDAVLDIKPVITIPERVLGKRLEFFEMWCKNHTYNEFWEKQDWFTRQNNIRDIPTLIVSGWYDDNGMGTTQALDIVREGGISRYRVLLGPWMHRANSIRDLAGIDLGNDAIRYNLDFEYYNWLYTHLVEADPTTHSNKTTPTLKTNNSVEYYLTGENRWVKDTKWPPSNTENVELFLGRDLILQTNSTHDSSQITTDVKEGKITYTYNPEKPAPHIVDISTNELSTPADYSEVENRPDVITFTSLPLEEELSIAGDIYVEFYASSTAPDTDWVVRITDVEPKTKPKVDSDTEPTHTDTNTNSVETSFTSLVYRSIKLADGFLSAKFRESFNRISFMERDKVYAFKIRTSKLAHTFKRGHMIRLSITSSAKNYIFPNSNTDKNRALTTEFKEALNTIYFGEKYPSKIVIPKIKW